MLATLELRADALHCNAPGSPVPAATLGATGLQGLLAAWSQRYEQVVRRHDEPGLLTLGREMFAALDAGGWGRAWAAAPEVRHLQLCVDDPTHPLAAALLDAPWELLAGPGGHLAGDGGPLFVVSRRVGAPQPPLAGRAGDIHMLFMAAAPEGEAELEFEAEEAGILRATRGLRQLHLVVEETGALQGLAERVATAAHPFDAVHLSCHGGIDARQGPYLALERPEGGPAQPVLAAELARALRNPDDTPLVFVSACRTAEAPDAQGSATASFVRQLVQAGVHNVLGWDGSVHDDDARHFAQQLYGELARSCDIPTAVALARRDLLQQQRRHEQPPHAGSHWHLARLVLGRRGGGTLVDPAAPGRSIGGPRRRNDFLDPARRQSPVATAEVFVGRRRVLQAVLRAFGQGRGVLLHGMGHLGKSSVAARIRDRLASQLRPVVLYRRFDALTVLDTLLGAVPAGQRSALQAYWRDRLQQRPADLVFALEELLTQTLAQAPVLLILDDLEHALEPPTALAEAAVPVQAEHRAALAAVLQVFAERETPSRLLLTSRYRFTLPGASGQDLAKTLQPVPLTPMRPHEQRKQLRAAAAGAPSGARDAAIEARVLAAAAGNPGLQAVLMQPLLQGERAAVERVLALWERWRTEGVVPAHLETSAGGGAGDAAEALAAFFRRQAFEVYRAALTDEQATTLASAAAFSPDVQVPLAAVQAGAEALGVTNARSSALRLLALGLLNDYGPAGDAVQTAIDPQARPLVRQPAGLAWRRWSAAVWPILDRHWTDSGDWVPADERGLELWRLVREAQDAPASVLNRAAEAAARALRDTHRAGSAMTDVIEPALARLAGAADAASARLLTIGLACGELLGRGSWCDDVATQLVDKLETLSSDDAVATLWRVGMWNRLRGRHEPAVSLIQRAVVLCEKSDDKRARSVLLGEFADILRFRGQLDEALRIHTEEALPVCEQLGDVRSKAVTMGKIADIMQARGQLDEALRIHTEEALPVYEQLGDVRLKAGTMGQIAEILEARGQVGEALRIRSEEELPVYEQLGDVRSKAVAMGRIADILYARGQLDEALRIHTEVALPVYEQLGDVREKAVTMGKIANILQARGQLDVALRIHTDEALPVYEQIGEVREKAVTMGKIADILQARGQLDEALRIHTEEVLPVYEQLGDVCARALTMGRIADILQARGQLDEALRIHTEEALPVYEQIGEVREKAVTMGKIADILQARGQLDDALRIHTEEVLPVFEQLGDVFSKALTMNRIAVILRFRGQLDEAMRILTEEALPIYEQLGDERSKAGTMGQIAEILHARGQLDEALRIHTEKELPVYEQLGDVRSKALAMGRIADILQARGQLDEALRIHTEEALPVFEQLGDVFSKASTMSRIADILRYRGQLDEALRIHTEEAVPVWEQLGDVRSKAVTMGKIADILQVRGQLDEALCIRRKEELPVYEQLGDVREMAVANGKIADVLEARGELEEALRIRSQKQLPVYEQLGDLRNKAVTISKIADILQACGQLDEALRIRTEEELPVYDRLGDVRDKAIAMNRIAVILEARGEIDEALRIHTEEALPVYEQLGDVESQALTMGLVAEILRARGQLDEALRIHTEKELPVYEQLGDLRSKALTMSRIADILQVRGQLDEALRIHTEEALPVFEQLGDVRSKALTMGRIADILQARGQLDEALRIHTEEELPFYGQLGDMRSKAVTMGKIAYILNARGQLDEALAAYGEKHRLAVQCGDTVEQTHALFRAAGVCLAQSSAPSSSKHEEARTMLADALRLSLEVGRVDAIVAIAAELARVLAEATKRNEAIELLNSVVAELQNTGAEEAAASLLQTRDAFPPDAAAA